jgi:MFS family permease
MIPQVVKRNTALIAVSQSFIGAGMQFAFGLVPLMVVALTGSAAWAGLAVGLIGLSRFLVAYPSGRITDAYGRKPAIQFGLALGLAGGLAVGAAMPAQSFLVLFAGMLLFGMGMNVAQQLRVAATDMYPPPLRARALGFVMTGSVIGVVLSPLLVHVGERLAPAFGQHALAMAWFTLPLLILPGMVLVSRISPDPKEIGQNLGRYYDGYDAKEDPRDGLLPFHWTDLLRQPRTRLAIASNCAGQGNMSIVMVLTALVLDHHGHSLSTIALSMALHSAGMFAFSIPIGVAADRYGRGRVMYPGVAMTLVGAALVAFTESWALVTLGSFLVGLGWAAANIAGTAVVADAVPTAQRGRAVGVADSFAGAAALAMALVTGPLVEWQGLRMAGLTAVLVAAVPLVMRLATPRSVARGG